MKQTLITERLNCTDLIAPILFECYFWDCWIGYNLCNVWEWDKSVYRVDDLECVYLLSVISM